jgi:hypothetical protein
LIGLDESQSTESYLFQFQELLQQFDRKLLPVQDINSQRLFDKIMVCGNTFVICKKLESILQNSGSVVVGDRCYDILNIEAGGEPDFADETAWADDNISAEVGDHDALAYDNADLIADEMLFAEVGTEEFADDGDADDNADDFLVPVYQESDDRQASVTNNEPAVQDSGASGTTGDSLMVGAEITLSRTDLSATKDPPASITLHYDSIVSIFPLAYSDIRPK